ncbi:MAG TPA: RnfH family protein [Ideonella sp.]|nr:RnfH family protein [Ideonella sp.]
MAPAEAPPTIGVTVVYSPAPRQVEQVVLQLPPGATVGDALRASGLAERHGWRLAEPGDEGLSVSVWSKTRALATPLREADRVEVTRGLRVDPKEARRQRYRKQPPKQRLAAKG